MAPKVHCSVAEIAEIASYTPASIFNYGYNSVLHIMQFLNTDALNHES